MGEGRIFVGTSGWSYDHWQGTFYPKGLPRRGWLAYYQERFPVVEINASFYRLPSETTVERWRCESRDEFVFAIKGSRFITHMKRLAGAEAGVDRLLSRVALPVEHRGPVLWQLPPDFERDDARLERFLAGLPRDFDHAIEFRHRSWVCSDVRALIERYGATMVSISSLAMPPERCLPRTFGYARFHGLEGGWQHDYSDEELAPWVEWGRELVARGCRGYFFFNNDGSGHAPKNALRCMELLGNAAAPWPPAV